MRRRATSTTSSKSSQSELYGDQELDTLYEYLAKVILLGPSGCGKSCILHRFVKGEWKVLSSQTIGVEFSSKIVKVAQTTGVKLQLWDTAGQERFRSLTRGYYRGSAGVVLVYDITNRESFEKLGEFMSDVKALTPSTVSVVVVANKVDLLDEDPELEEVSQAEVLEFCNRNGNIPVINASALTGRNVDEIFDRLSSMIVTKIELGVINPEDMDAGVQYGQVPRWDGTIGRSNNRSLLTLLGGTRNHTPSQPGRRSGCC